MQKNIHPEYAPVVFRDVSCDKTWLIRSTIKSNLTTVWEDGTTYPLVNLDVSSASHPAYTGEQRQAKVEGRVANFNKRFGKRGLKTLEKK